MKMLKGHGILRYMFKEWQNQLLIKLNRIQFTLNVNFYRFLFIIYIVELTHLKFSTIIWWQIPILN